MLKEPINGFECLKGGLIGKHRCSYGDAYFAFCGDLEPGSESCVWKEDRSRDTEECSKLSQLKKAD